MSNHTPEPWRYHRNHRTILGDSEERNEVATVTSFFNYETREYLTELQDDNAARIVECVNAMAGIEDPVEFMREIKQISTDNFEWCGAWEFKLQHGAVDHNSFKEAIFGGKCISEAALDLFPKEETDE